MALIFGRVVAAALAAFFVVGAAGASLLGSIGVRAAARPAVVSDHFLSMGDSCGVEVGGKYVCWGYAPPPPASIAGGLYSAVSDTAEGYAPEGVACLIKREVGVGGPIVCTGPPISAVPSGRFIHISIGYSARVRHPVESECQCWARRLSVSLTSFHRTVAIITDPPIQGPERRGFGQRFFLFPENLTFHRKVARPHSPDRHGHSLSPRCRSRPQPHWTHDRPAVLATRGGRAATPAHHRPDAEARIGTAPLRA